MQNLEVLQNPNDSPKPQRLRAETLNLSINAANVTEGFKHQGSMLSGKSINTS